VIFAPEGNDKTAASEGLSEPYVLCVSSVEPRKNLTTLVEAWKRTRVRNEGIKLVVAGGAARKAVFDITDTGMQGLDDTMIRWLGYFSDEHLPLLYQGAEAFVLPSFAEGFGLPVLEAMACGTPVICSDNTALPEISGGAACLAPALEPEAWVEAIDSVLSHPDLRQRMRADGFRHASKFSWSKTAGAVRSVLNAV
jgi:alpha-1,3-rhamnosyl/mannosyltransferase